MTIRILPITIGLLCGAFSATLADDAADWAVTKVGFELNGSAYESIVLAPKNAEGPLPGVFMVPNWMGVTDRAIEKAKRVSGGRLVVYIADMYGASVRPADASEAGQASGMLRGDREEMRQRANAALNHFKSLAGNHGADPARLAAIGFCFGGGAILELARSGAAAVAFVSFHGDLISPTLEADAAAIRGPVLVLHGAADPLVPDDHVNMFKQAMAGTEVDWTFISYGGAVHSFTDPTANAPGRAMYDERTAKRAFREMHSLFAEAFASNP